MQYIVAPEIFTRYPGFIRAVIIARGINNREENSELLSELRAAEQTVRETIGDDFKEHPKLKPWAEAFRSMNINPNKYPPSVTNLIKRVRSGKDLPYINSLVAAFNCISLRNLCPCGGDDLAALEGDLLLTIADGSELYTPLGQADISEHPRAGEVIYMDSATKDVFCRAWCWKNGDKSKMSATTSSCAINIDIMPPMEEADARRIADELSKMLEKYTGASCETFILSPQSMQFSISDA